jgi:hypothetical protein
VSAVTKPKLDNISAAIFVNVCKAMQDAEEIWGPGEEHYPDLMDAIIAECEARKTNCYLQHARDQGVTVVPAPRLSGMAVVSADNIEADAIEALEMMDAIGHDSFGTVDAVRSLAGYDSWSGDYREKVVIRLRELIGGAP